MAVLLQLLEQVAKAAADHASRRAACEQAAQSAGDQTAETAATARAGIRGRGAWRWCGRRRRRGARLAGGQMFEGLEGEQSEDGHRHRRHAAAAAWCAWRAGAARAVLHAVEYVE